MGKCSQRLFVGLPFLLWCKAKLSRASSQAIFLSEMGVHRFWLCAGGHRSLGFWIFPGIQRAKRESKDCCPLNRDDSVYEAAPTMV